MFYKPVFVVKMQFNFYRSVSIVDTKICFDEVVL
jgi:hypothetical protein